MIKISAKELQSKVASMHTKRHVLYDKVFERCVKGKLQYAAKQGIPFCVANIQMFMPGFPAFDPVSCTLHIRDALLRKGFHVQIMSPHNNLLISWLTTNNAKHENTRLLPSSKDMAAAPFDFAAFQKPNGKKVMFIQ
jgi:hypothetical protein